jgi:hypothetical protein
MTLEETIDRYCLAWSTADPAERSGHLNAVCSEQVSYTDPRVDLQTPAMLLEDIAALHAQRPGLRITRTSQVDTHHGIARFAWRLTLNDGSTFVEGVDFLELSSSGSKIERISGFFGSLVPLAADDA